MMNAGQVLNGRYQIVKEIGKGGMSVVYQAKDLTNGNLLAIKDVARTGQQANQVVEQSLVTEGRMLMQLTNSHLPKIYDIIENPESFMLVMDYIQGESLDKVIAREGAQPMARVLDWGMQICEVFDYLHNQPKPIIYRDMKPANVILQPNGQLMMIDFGTARTQKDNVVMAADTVCFGTAGFAAPEQFGGFGQSTARTDIFCLGGTLYNMITGHSPCDRPTGIRPLEEWNPALKDTPISYIIYKCTRNDPDMRYQTAKELYDDLHKAQTGNFGDPSTWGQSGKLTGNLGKAWQKQDVKQAVGGITGLSGLLPFGKNAAQEKAEPAAKQSAGGWQTNQAMPAAQAQQPQQPMGHSMPAYGATVAYNHHWPAESMKAEQDAQNSVWRKLMLICLLISVVMLVFSLISIALSLVTIGLVFLIIALGAAVLAAVGVVMFRRSQS